MNIENQKDLLQRVVDFSNGKPLNITSGTFTNRDGVPMLIFPVIPSEDIPWDCLRAEVRTALELIVKSPEGIVYVSDMINRRDLPMMILLPENGCGIAVPQARTIYDTPWVILAVAATTPVGEGVLTDLVNQCQWCSCYFLSKTFRGSKYCCLDCRTASNNFRAGLRRK